MSEQPQKQAKKMALVDFVNNATRAIHTLQGSIFELESNCRELANQNSELKEQLKDDNSQKQSEK